VPALRTLLKDSDVQVRRAGAAALRDLLRGTPAADRTGSVSSPVVEPATTNLPVFGPQVAKAAGDVLGGWEPDAGVRARCAEPLLEVGPLVAPRLRLYSGIIGTTPHEQLGSVVDALWGQTKALNKATRDSAPGVRSAAIRALEEMGNVRYH